RNPISPEKPPDAPHPASLAETSSPLDSRWLHAAASERRSARRAAWADRPPFARPRDRRIVRRSRLSCSMHFSNQQSAFGQRNIATDFGRWTRDQGEGIANFVNRNKNSSHTSLYSGIRFKSPNYPITKSCLIRIHSQNSLLLVINLR